MTFMVSKLRCLSLKLFPLATCSSMKDVAMYDGTAIIRRWPEASNAIQSVKQAAETICDRPLFLIRAYPRFKDWKFPGQ